MTKSADRSTATREELLQEVERLRKSEEEVALFFDLVPDLACVASPDGFFRRLSASWEAVLGFTREELLAAPFAEWIHPEDVEPTLREVQKQLAGGRTARFTNRYRTKDGSYRWLEWEAMPAADGLLYAAARDVTEPKRAESALRDALRFNRQVIESMRDGVIVYGPDLRYRVWNSAMERISGRPASEVVGHHPEELFPFLEDAGVLDIVKDCLANGTTHTADFQYHLPDLDRSGWTSDTSAPLRDASGAIVGVISTVREITAGKRAEEQLAYFEMAVRNATDAIGMSTPEGRHYFQNEAFTQLFGLSTAEVDGQSGPPSTIYVDEEVGRLVFGTIMAGGTYVGEVQMFDRERNVKDIFLRAYAIRDRQGKIAGLVGVHTDITERKRMEQELRETIRALDESQAVAALGSYVFDAGTGTWTSSRELDRLFGITDAAFPRDLAAWESLVHPDDREAMAAYFAEDVLGKKARFDREYRIVRLHDQAERWVHGLGRLTFDGQHHVVSMIGTIQDITERKRSELALQRSEEYLRLAVAGGGVGLWEWNLRTEELEWNDRLKAIFGLPPETTGLTYGQFVARIHPDDASETSRRIRRALDAQGEFRHEYRIVCPDGSVRWIEAIGRGVRDRSGDLVRMTGTALDVTERKEAEENLRAAKEYSETLVDTANVIVVGLDAAGTVTVFNQTAEKVTGYSAAELQGRNWFEVLVPKARYPLVWEEFTRLTQGGVPKVFENPILTKSGNERLISWRNSEIRRGGEVAGTISFGIDVTEHRQLEEQFRQSQKMEAVGRLAGGIAHDFNNLLTAIIGNCEIVGLKLPPEAPVARDIAEIRKAGERAAALVRQLLAFSRKQILQPRVLNLAELVADTQAMLGRLLGEDIEIRVFAAPDTGLVKADPGQMEQVILNLAVNARDAMPLGGKLTVETKNVRCDESYAERHPGLRAGPHVALTVSDTGCGMDAATRARAFEPFFTTKEVGRGTGLGLATVHGIVNQSGGHIWLYSEVGKGTTFRIYFPRVDGEPPGAPSQAGLQEPPRGEETVLLAEDEEAVRALARRMLEARGYRVLAAPDGYAALDAARAEDGPIHLLLTDVVMPGMSGRELAERVSALRPGVKVLYMSGYAETAIVHHGVLDGGLHFIQKPFHPGELARKVREVLDETTLGG